VDPCERSLVFVSSFLFGRLGGGGGGDLQGFLRVPD
jgi:hypothetical protein